VTEQCSPISTPSDYHVPSFPPMLRRLTFLARRWFSFKSMGIGPSPRCGHTMTTSRDKLIVLGGESATNVTGKDESTVAFILDTSKIRFPSDSAFPSTSVPSTMTKQPSSTSSNKVRNLTSPPPAERVRSTTSPPPPQQQQPQQQSFRPTSRGNTESPRVNAEEPPRSAGSRTKIRSPSPTRGGVGGSLKSRGEGERPHVRSSSGGSTPQSMSGSMRGRTTTPPNIQIGGMATTQSQSERPERPERPIDRQIERGTPDRGTPSTDRQPFDRSTNDRAMDRSIERSTPIDRQPLSQKQIQSQVNGTPVDFPLITADQNPKSAQTPVQEDIESNGGDQSPSEPKHSETHADDTSTPSLQSSPHLTSSAPSLDDLKKRLAWMTTELALAQSRGYTPDQYPDDDDLDFLGTQEFQVKDTKLLQALLSTRHQLARVKELVKDQTRTASERISEAERQRDEALADASYIRARLAAAQSGDESPARDDRATELSKKLVVALAIQNELTVKLEGLEGQLQVEKTARQVAEETAQSHFGKYDDVERRRKEAWIQLEEFREKHADAQRVAVEERAKSVDHVAVVGNLRVEAEELKRQVVEMTELLDVQTNAVQATKVSINSAVERAEAAENSLQLERSHRIELEKEIVQLKQELGSLDDHHSRIEDLERQLKQAREEADSHRNITLTKLDTIVNRSSPTTSTDYEGRIRTLQDHLDSTKSLHAESRQQVDAATRDLSKANERITTLESSQSQSVREVADLQSRLSETLDQLQHLQGEHTKVRSRMTDVQRDLDASYVKHSAIKQLFSERPSSSSPARGSGTPEFSNKIRELERQLEESGRLREELESSQEQVMQNLSVASKRHKEATRRQRDAEDRVKKLEEELERASNISGSGSVDVAEANRRTAEAEKKLADSTVVFQDRLTQLEADYQSAVHYVKGTEKMIRRMKEELTKYKSQNAFLQSELHELKRQSFKGSDEEQQGWEAEKDRMVKEIEALQVAQKSESSSASEQIKLLQTKLDQHAEERDVLKSQLVTIQKDYQSATERTKDMETQLKRLQDDNTSKSRLETELSLAKAASKRLEQENELLETRAIEAEEKVSLLLDQVESSVDTYRRSIVAKRSEERNSPPISPRSSSVGNRTSVALDSLAHELDQLRSHWESSTHRYRLSTASSLGGHESPTRGSATTTTTGLGLHPFDFDQSRVTTDDASTKINGVRLDSPRWRDDVDTQLTPTQAHFRQVTA
jgi:chromosome segregation ATPase